MGITVVKGYWGSLVITRSYWEQGLGGHRVRELRTQWVTLKSGAESLGATGGSGCRVWDDKWG